MIGLGRMGGNMVQRLLNGGHRVVTFDRDGEAVAASQSQGAVGVSSPNDLVAGLPAQFLTVGFNCYNYLSQMCPYPGFQLVLRALTGGLMMGNSWVRCQIQLQL